MTHPTANTPDDRARNQTIGGLPNADQPDRSIEHTHKPGTSVVITDPGHPHHLKTATYLGDDPSGGHRLQIRNETTAAPIGRIRPTP